MNTATGFVATTAASVCLLCGIAEAGTYALSALNDDSALTDAFVGNPNARQFQLTNFGSTTMNFGNSGQTGSTEGTISANGGFYFDLAGTSGSDGLGSNWFSGATRPSAATPVLAFGASGSPQTNGVNTGASSLTIDFAPGVAGFGFNFHDIEGSVLTVIFNDTGIQDLVINIGPTSSDGNTQSNGFLALIADAGLTIDKVVLSRTVGVNDGISMYGFTTMAVVPLPPAAWAGLAMLGGVAGVRKLRRR
jgi:hypothetical protein